MLLLVGLVLVALGILGVRWWLYTRRPNWSGAYWAPLRRSEVTRLAFVGGAVALAIAGGQSRSNDQQHAPWGVYAVIFVVLAVSALRVVTTGVQEIVQQVCFLMARSLSRACPSVCPSIVRH